MRALVFLHQRLDGPLDLDELAQVACFSPYHFHRVFTGMVGEGVMEHLRRLRLERAAVRLRQTRRSVTDIALEAGYESHGAFTRAFHRHFGESPSAFRRHRGNPPIWKSSRRVHYRPDGRLASFAPRKDGTKMDVRVERIQPMRVAFVRHVGPYDQCGGAWEKLMRWAAPLGILGGQTKHIGICHDDPEITPPEKIRYDACVTIDVDVTPAGDIGVQEIPGGDYAIVTHFGPYSHLKQTYAKLFGQWLPHSNREMASAPCFELYLNDPEGTDPKDLLTDIHVPLEETCGGRQ